MRRFRASRFVLASSFGIQYSRFDCGHLDDFFWHFVEMPEAPMHEESLFCGLGTLGLAIPATSDSVAGTEIQLDATPNAAPSLASYRATESAPSVRCAWPWLSCPCVTLAPHLYRLSLIFTFGSVSNICSSVNRRVSIVGVAHGVLQLRDERVDIPAEIPNIDREEYNVAVCGGSSQASNLEPVGREHEKGVSALERRSVNQKLIDVARCGTPVPRPCT